MSSAAIPIIHLSISGIPELEEHLEAAVNKGMMLEAAGRGVSNLVIRHLRERNNKPARPGWPKSNYWGDAADSTQTDMEESAAVVRIHAPGIRLRQQGGDVQSKSGGALAIPARPEVAGIWPSEYSGKDRIFLLVRKAFGKAYLAERDGGGHLRILWRLVKKTHHIADPSVLPRDSSLNEAARSAVQSILPQAKT